MKYLILTILFISALGHAREVPMNQRDGMVDCCKTVEGNPANGKELDIVRGIANATSKPKPKPDYGLLASRICSFYSSASSLVKSVKHLIMTFMKNEVLIENPTPADALKFLNLHKNELTCQGKHIINYAFERGKYNEIVDDLFNDDDGIYTEEVHLDFNAITKTKNLLTGVVEPMTVLDYIDNVALVDIAISGHGPDSPARREITELRELLVEDFGAVSFTELPLKERQDFEAVNQFK